MKEALDGKLDNSDISARYYSLLFLIAMHTCLSSFGLKMLNTEPCLSVLLCYACDLYVKKKHTHTRRQPILVLARHCIQPHKQ